MSESKHALMAKDKMSMTYSGARTLACLCIVCQTSPLGDLMFHVITWVLSRQCCQGHLVTNSRYNRSRQHFLKRNGSAPAFVQRLNDGRFRECGICRNLRYYTKVYVSACRAVFPRTRPFPCSYHSPSSVPL